MSEQLTENLTSVMAAKTNDQLLDVISEKHRYEFQAVIAAFEELERRQLSTTELEQEKEAFIAEYNANVIAKQNDMHGVPTAIDLLKIKSEYFCTPIILYTNILVYIVMVANGVNFFDPSVDDLISWGGNLRAITLDGELWRLFTSVFMHGGLLHLALNMYALVQLGYILEPNIGRTRFAVGYLAAGIFASIASIAWNDNIVSVGASGAIFGLDGILLALLLAKQLNIPEEQRKGFLSSTMIFIGYNLFYGFVKEGIDNAAHIGGLISGFGIGFAYGRVSTEKRNLVLSSAILAVMIIAIALAPTFISNKLGEYQRAMETFGANEQKALWMYDEKTWEEESKNKETFNNRLQTEGIDIWVENLSLLNSLTDMPDYLQARIELLKKYCMVRREMCEAMKVTADAPEGDLDKATALSAQIETIIGELDALNK